MLKSYLTSRPYTKFVLIEDSLEERGQPIFDFLVGTHLDRPQSIVHLFTFHGSFARALKRFGTKTNFVIHDFTSNSCGWNGKKNEESFEDAALKLSANDVVVVDSLAHAIHQCGLSETYRVFNALKNQAVAQVIALLHKDLLPSTDKVNKTFEHLCTLSLVVEPKFRSEDKRVQYTYKKLSGRVIKQVEEYNFVNGDLFTKKIERLDPKKLLQESVVPQVNPETLSTFKIGLSDKEKEAREQLVLPYLPKNEEESKEEEGAEIFYQLDEVDDWDEEDPDDDLDI
ncbi:hypothetical protein NQ315_000173 [Exocentrus adspersus]|uniref:Elongator complex protein 5 n=1 Tax=Exocentrus adspersus TaxID=1586481 RepID=A0AAV8VQ10_9CUCU|nr:hypothetical protein NQ315_000173 [Exocentrus adspersus]